MRGFAYTAAVIAAIGIMISIAVMPPINANQSGTTRLSISTVTLSVPTMSCEFSCFPKVKETLEATEGVQSVELAKQKEEGTIDNRQVIVRHDSRLDMNAALISLAGAGFSDSNVVP